MSRIALSQLSSLVIACTLGLGVLPGAARAACPDRADRLFAYPYGEPPADCASGSGVGRSDEQLEHDDVMMDSRGRALQTAGFTGMGAGTTLAGLGGMSLLVSLTMSEGTQGRQIARGMGIGAAIAGGAVFLAGATLLGIDALIAPSPTADGRGAQLMVAFRFP